jgi:catechol 2,3-dioxygenase-like lactoylglutathione lyase family enzyme
VKKTTAATGRRTPKKISTYGLTHISLAVRDPERALRFYEQVFGVKEYYRDANTIQVLGPGPHDVLAFEKNESMSGTPGGIAHFGFRLVRPKDLDAAVELVKSAGGTIKEQGEFAPGFPFAFVKDPDGYEIEIWFE